EDQTARIDQIIRRSRYHRAVVIADAFVPLPARAQPKSRRHLAAQVPFGGVPSLDDLRLRHVVLLANRQRTGASAAKSYCTISARTRFAAPSCNTVTQRAVRR